MENKANTYSQRDQNPTTEHSDKNRPNLGVCFSGGGSRAMTCAWGQLLGLNTLQLMNRVRYISSVSGGTWASSIYTYLPDAITDDDLLGAYFPPEKLSLESSNGNLDVNSLSPHSMGVAPAGMGVKPLLESAAMFLLFHKKSNYKWLWADLVAQYILDHYELRSEGHRSWSSSKFFSLTEEYAKDAFPPDAPALNEFFFVRSGRPFLVMNNNLMEKIKTAELPGDNIVQLPNQVTPVSGGVSGQTPDGSIVGGGMVESYGYSSTLLQESSDPSPVDIDISQPYSLIDIVSTSSAFFAETIAKYLQSEVQDTKRKKALASRIENKLVPMQKKNLWEKIEDDVEESLDLGGAIERELEKIVKENLSFLSDIVPVYNYWPISRESSNRYMEFTDGGTLENTGILGLLAQTDTRDNEQQPLFIVAFDNTSTPLEKKNNRIIAGSQAAPLFGIDFSTRDGSYAPFTASQMNPESKDFKPESLIQVFSNAGPSGCTPFDTLIQDLYATSCGVKGDEKPDDEKVDSAPPFSRMTVTTVNNDLAGITGGRTVQLLYIQNAKMLDWQNRLSDKTLSAEILKGQTKEDDPFGDFKNFPCFSTFFKIGLSPKESNSLSQMWAWAILDSGSLLKNELTTFFDSATGAGSK